MACSFKNFWIRLLGVETMPVLLFIVIFMITYVACFSDEFDQENIKSVWIILGGFAALVLLVAIFSSIGVTNSTNIR